MHGFKLSSDSPRLEIRSVILCYYYFKKKATVLTRKHMQTEQLLAISGSEYVSFELMQ